MYCVDQDSTLIFQVNVTKVYINPFNIYFYFHFKIDHPVRSNLTLPPKSCILYNLQQRFSNFSFIRTNWRICQSADLRVSDSIGLEWIPITCISNRFPGGVVTCWSWDHTQNHCPSLDLKRETYTHFLLLQVTLSVIYNDVTQLYTWH